MRKTRSLLLGITLGVGMTACAVATDDATDPAPGEEVSSTPAQQHASKTTSSTSTQRLDPVLGKLTSKVASESLLAKLAAHERQVVLVALDKAQATSLHEKGRTHDFAALGQAVMAKVDRSVVLKRTFSHVPMMTIEVSSREALAQVLRHEGVVRVYENELRYAPSLDSESEALIKHSLAVGAGGTATGMVIANIDTGIDYTVDSSVFGNCSGGPGTGTCRVSANVEVEDPLETGLLDYATDGVVDKDDHGTFVGAILADAAPGATIRSYDVFKADNKTADTDAVIAAIDDAITQNVDIINLEVASVGTFSGDCGTSAPKNVALEAEIIEAAISAGIVVVVPAGNTAAKSGLAAPACVSGVVAVGAVYDAAGSSTTFPATSAPIKTWYTGSSCTDPAPAADAVPCFSNSAMTLTLLAPGWNVTTLGDDGTKFGGTSAAAPFAAAAAAMLRHDFPSEPPELISYRMSLTGTTVTDSKSKVKTPRLDVQAALAPDCIAKVTVDDTLDTNGTLKFSNTGESPSKHDYVTATVLASCNWTIDTSTALPAWLVIDDDGTAPFTGTASGTANVESTFAIAVDLAGIGKTTQSYTITLKPSSAGVTYVGKTVPVSLAPDVATPTKGTISIAAGATHTGSTQPSVTLDAADDSGYVEYCLSATSTGCAATAVPAPTFYPLIPAQAVPYTVAAGDPSIPVLATDGSKTIYAAFRDHAGNVRNATDSIILDTTAPAVGTLTATAGVSSVSLSGTGFTDASSGVGSIKIVRATGSAPADCTGTALDTVAAASISGGAFTYTDATAANDTAYFYRACAIDNVGNMSAGSASSSVTPTGDVTGPVVSSVVLTDTTSGSTTASDSKLVQVAITATDPANSGTGAKNDNVVAGACVSNATIGTCTAVSGNFVAWPGSGNTLTIASFDLSGGAMTFSNGTKTVYVKVIDNYGNASTQSTKTIIFDTTAPTGGTIAVTPGNAQNTIKVTSPSDTSAIASYKLLRRTNSTWASTDCANAFATSPTYASGTTLVTTQAGTADIVDDNAGLGLSNSTYAVTNTYYYKLCAQDNAGNVSAGVLGSGTPRAETSKPVISSVTFRPAGVSSAAPYWTTTAPYYPNLAADGTTHIAYTSTAYTNVTSGTVTITASDSGGSGLYRACVLNSSAYTSCSWKVVTFTSGVGSMSVTLPTTDGGKTMYVWVQDAAGNIAANKTFTVKIDRSGPSNSSTVSYSFAPASSTLTTVTLKWTAVADIGGSGVKAYKAFYATGTSAPSSTLCASSSPTMSSASYNSTTKLWSASKGSLTRSTSTSSKYVSFRICVQDNLGKWNTGVTKTSVKIP